MGWIDGGKPFSLKPEGCTRGVNGVLQRDDGGDKDAVSVRHRKPVYASGKEVTRPAIPSGDENPALAHLVSPFGCLWEPKGGVPSGTTF